jgi:quinol-cytochrome oxidoreductase complex cytochrome b subunit
VVLHAVLRDPARRPRVHEHAGLGRLALFAAVLLLFFVPWLDKSPVKSIRYRGPIYKVSLMSLPPTSSSSAIAA